MKRLRIFIRNFFGFSKTESNAAIVLILIVLLVAILPRIYLRLAVDHEAVAVDSLSLLAWHEQVRSTLRPKQERPVVATTTPKQTPKRFQFDPNTASALDLQSLGFKSFIAERIVNYRQAGGQFKVSQDLYRIYGVDSILVAALEPYIAIEPKKEPTADFLSSADTLALAADPHEQPSSTTMLSLDLNLASAEELQQIRGIGPFYSTRVVSYRSALGGFHSLQQLSEVYGMKKEIVDLLKKHTFIGQGADKNILINSDSAMLIAKHPYVNWNQARAIVSYREQHGDYRQLTELKKIKIIDDSLYQKILPYLSVDK